jgi:hypothetical protein
LCFGLLWLLVGAWWGLRERDCWTARSDDTGRRTSRVVSLEDDTGASTNTTNETSRQTSFLSQAKLLDVIVATISIALSSSMHFSTIYCVPWLFHWPTSVIGTGRKQVMVDAMMR